MTHTADIPAHYFRRINKSLKVKYTYSIGVAECILDKYWKITSGPKNLS